MRGACSPRHGGRIWKVTLLKRNTHIFRKIKTKVIKNRKGPLEYGAIEHMLSPVRAAGGSSPHQEAGPEALLPKVT